MFCHNCGEEIKNDAKFCPYCGAKQQKTKSATKPEEIPKTKRKRPRKKQKKTKAFTVIIILLALAVLVMAVGFLIRPKLEFLFQKKRIEQAAIVQSEVFMSGDMDRINDLVFSSGDSIVSFPDNTGIKQDESVLSTWNQGSENSIMRILFANTQINVVDITQDTIQYSITSPDFSNFFADCEESLSAISEAQEVFDLLNSYSVGVDKVQKTVNLPYTYNAEALKVEYQSQEFVNAISGGLFEAYAELYNQLINAYREEMQGQ